MSGVIFAARLSRALCCFSCSGLSEAALDAIAKGVSPPGVLTPAQHAVMIFADEVIRNANASDAALAEVRRHLDDNQLMDLMMVIGIYMMQAFPPDFAIGNEFKKLVYEALK